MKRFFNGFKKITFKTIPVIIGILLLLGAINYYFAAKDVNHMREYGKSVEQDSIAAQWETIESLLVLSDQTSRENSKRIAQKLEYEIVSQYDLSKLEKQFRDNDFQQDFYNILQKNFVKEQPNPLFPSPYQVIVGFNTGVISIFSSEGNVVKIPQTEKVLPWKTFFEMYPNPRSVESAVASVKSKDRKLIIIQREQRNSLRVKEEHLTLDELEQVFRTGGIKALEDFNILAPAYIRDNGDIFDNTDQQFMQTNKTYKLFIIQSTRIGDILDTYHADLSSQGKNLEATLKYVDDYIYHKYFQTIIWSFVLFAISMVLVSVYNHETRKACLSCPSVKKDDQKN